MPIQNLKLTKEYNCHIQLPFDGYGILKSSSFRLKEMWLLNVNIYYHLKWLLYNLYVEQLHSGLEPTDDTFSLLQSNNSNNTNVQEWTVNYCFASNDDSADGKPRKFQKVFLQKSVSASASPISLSPEKGKDPTETRSYASDDGIGMDDSLPRNNSASMSTKAIYIF